MSAVAYRLRRAGTWDGPPQDRVVLSYAERLLRRRMLTCETGAKLLVDLPETVSVSAGDAFEVETGRGSETGSGTETGTGTGKRMAPGTGRLVAVVAAQEPLAEIRADGADGAALVRLAWHVGNRHTPAEIGPDRIRLLRDHVIEDMLQRLGATIHHVTAPFTPEGGAYGIGRVMGHDHGDASGSWQRQERPDRQRDPHPNDHAHDAPPTHRHG
ncbi:MAG: urease accessory protein UreE [Pseudomonadota bacterium]